MNVAKISKELRKERELAFYGDIDFIPTNEYTINDAKEAIEGANFAVNIIKRIVRK
jgi:HEPN domain-containing protein